MYSSSNTMMYPTLGLLSLFQLGYMVHVVKITLFILFNKVREWYLPEKSFKFWWATTSLKLLSLQVLRKIQDITDSPEYLHNDNDQSVVEICITRVTSAIRENASIERHAPGLVALLESCLKHNLRPSNKDEDPPHAKIASDVMSCLFLVGCIQSQCYCVIYVQNFLRAAGKSGLCCVYDMSLRCVLRASSLIRFP